MASPDTILEVAHRAGLKPKERGAEFVVACPWPADHRNRDAHPSCRLNPEKNTFYCDPCGRGGGLVEFARLLGVGLDPGVRAERKSSSKARREKQQSFSASGPISAETKLLFADRIGKSYTPDAWAKAGVLEGAVGEQPAIAFSLPSGGHKVCLYLQPDPKRNKPYSLRFTDGGKVDLVVIGDSSEVLLVAGEWDMLAALSAGFDCVATGTGGEGTWKPEWNERLRGKQVFVTYDVDADGCRGSREVATSLNQFGITAFIVELPLVNTERDGKDLSDYLSLNSSEELRALLTAARDDGDRTRLPATTSTSVGEIGDAEQVWEQPAPFHAFRLPDFPVHALPDDLSRFVEALAVATQTPTALVGGQVLTACAVGLGGRCEVEIRPGWREPTNIFTATALAPGNRKTAVVSAVTRPILDFEREEARRLAPEISEAEARRRILRKRVAELEKRAAKAKPEDRGQCEQEAIAVAQALSLVIVPPSPRVFADDVTPEQLANLISNHEGRFAVLSAEGGIFDTLAGRYSGKGEPNIDVFLKGHAGDPLRVDRVGRAADVVDHPSLTVGLAVQPDVLRRLEAKPGFRGRGLLARFLYAIPENMVGRRRIGAPAVPDDLLRQFQTTIGTILRFSPAHDSEGRPTPHILRFDRRAEDAFRTFETSLEPRLASAADLGPIADWGAKLAGAIARLSAIIHITKNIDHPAPWVTEIDADTIARGIELGEYFLAHARAAFAEMGADIEIEGAKHVLAWIRRRGLEQFSERNAYQGMKGRFRKVAEVRPALRLLVDHNYIRQMPSPERGGSGRKPSPIFEVNPNSEDIGNCGEGNQRLISTTSPPPDSNFIPDCDPQNSHNPQNRSGPA